MCFFHFFEAGAYAAGASFFLFGVLFFGANRKSFLEASAYAAGAFFFLGGFFWGENLFFG